MFWRKKKVQQPPAVQVPEGNTYLSDPMDRVLLALSYAALYVESKPETGDPNVDRDTTLDALGFGAVAWALPDRKDPMVFDQMDASLIFAYLRKAIAG